MNESDERYSTAEDAIYDAFFLLLKEKDLEKIDDAILGQFELVFMDDAAQALEKVILGGVPEAA